MSKALSKAARSLAFRSANDALWRDVRHAEMLDALRALRAATVSMLAALGPSASDKRVPARNRAAVEQGRAALAQADRALAHGEPPRTGQESVVLQPELEARVP